MKTFVYHESMKYPELNNRYYNLTKALAKLQDVSVIYIVNGKGKQKKEDNFKYVYSESKYSVPEDAILINGNPEMHDNVIKINHSKYIFDVSVLPVMRYADWEKHIQKALIAADYITASTTKCKNYVKNTTSKKCMILKNGVDIRLFMDSTPLLGLHNDRHTVGILGDPLNINWDLLDSVIRQCAEYNFIFFTDRKRTYPSHGNMFFTQERTPEEYIPIVKGLDLMIVPYKNDALTMAMEYLNLYECIANEKPIVATSAIAETSGLMRRAIDIQDNAVDFANSIKIAIDGNNSLIQKPSISMVEEDTWENRAKELVALLDL
jgi:hypothetical protein